MKKIIFFIFVIVIGLVFFFSSNSWKFLFIYNADDLKGKISEEDHSNLKELEQKFSDACKFYPGDKKDYDNSIKECRLIAEEKNKIIRNYSYVNRVDWICRIGGKTDLGYEIK